MNINSTDTSFSLKSFILRVDSVHFYPQFIEYNISRTTNHCIFRGTAIKATISRSPPPQPSIKNGCMVAISSKASTTQAKMSSSANRSIKLLRLSADPEADS